MESSEAGVAVGEAYVFSWLAVAGAFTFGLMVQFFLLRIHRLRTVLPVENIPSSIEIWAAIVVLWACQMVVENVAFGILRGVLRMIGDGQLITAWNGDSYAEMDSLALRPGWYETSAITLVSRVFVSWLIHYGLVILLDVSVPFIKNYRRDPRKALTRLVTRLSTLLDFLHAISLGSLALPVSTLKSLVQDTNSTPRSQSVRLQRTQTENPNQGQRNLAWNLVVDRHAMDEIKETLGPTGAFGELGFSVSGDVVRFEAMGKGTSFVLEFEIEPRAGRRRRPIPRRKTK